MKINVYTICKNEARIAKFMVDYWASLADDVHIYVYDGYSDDGTQEILAQYPFVTIIEDERLTSLDVLYFTSLKNKAWTGDDSDFVLVCDFDEALFSKDVETLRNDLQFMKDNGYTILSPLSFNIVSDIFPEYNGKDFLHELCVYGNNLPKWYTKPVLFDPKQVQEMNYIPGAHHAFPSGNVNYYYSPNTFLIHCKFLGADFVNNKQNSRVYSENSQKRGFVLDPKYNVLNEFNSFKKDRFTWNNAIEHTKEYYGITQDHRAFGGELRYFNDLNFDNKLL